MTLSASASSGVPYRNIAVIDIGSMGGGMARALMDANVSQTVTAYDHATALVQSFFDDSQATGKAATPQAPTSRRIWWSLSCRMPNNVKKCVLEPKRTTRTMLHDDNGDEIYEKRFIPNQLAFQSNGSVWPGCLSTILKNPRALLGNVNNNLSRLVFLEQFVLQV